MPTYLDTADAAALLGVSQDGVRDLCRNGRLHGAIKDPSGGSWLIPSSAIAGWLAEQSGMLPAAGDQPEPEKAAGDRFRVGDISGSNVAIGRSSQVTVSHGLSGDQLSQLFGMIYQRIDTRPEDPNVDKTEISQTVQNIEVEAVKGEQANPNKVERWLKNLAHMAPDILDVTMAALLSPTAAVAEVIRKVAAKAQQETGGI